MHTRSQATGPTNPPSTRRRLLVVAAAFQACLLAVALPAMGQQAVRPYSLPVDEVRRFADVLRAAVNANSPEKVAGDIAIGDGMVTAAGVCQERQCATMSLSVTTVDIRRH